MKKKVAVTGMGIVCNIAGNARKFFQALSNPPLSYFTRNPRIKLAIDLTVGEAKEENFSKPCTKTFDSLTSRLCLSAARECYADLKKTNKNKPIDGLILGTSAGGQNSSEDFTFSLLEGKTPPVFNYNANGMMVSPTRAVARDLGIKGKTSTISTACSSSANAIAIGAGLIESGRCQCVMAGGGDALCATTMSGFHILKLTGSEPARPFGPDRPGLTLGEGAAFLILEPLDQVISDKRDYYALLSGYGMTSDAYHMTAPDKTGNGALNCMQNALQMANLKTTDINFINAHGTGTLFNDRIESMAIKKVFNNTPAASLKGLTGHTLGAAGAIEAVASLYCLIQKQAFENFNSHITGEDCQLTIVNKKNKELSEIKHVLSNSFGFGGNNCSLIFSQKQT